MPVVQTGEMGGTVGDDVSSTPLKSDESASKSKCEVIIGAGVAEAAGSSSKNRKEKKKLSSEHSTRRLRHRDICTDSDFVEPNSMKNTSKRAKREAEAPIQPVEQYVKRKCVMRL